MCFVSLCVLAQISASLFLCRLIMRVKKRMGKKMLLRIPKMKRVNQKRKRGPKMLMKKIKTGQMVMILHIFPLCLRLKKRELNYLSQQRCE